MILPGNSHNFCSPSARKIAPPSTPLPSAAIEAVFLVVRAWVPNLTAFGYNLNK